MSIYEPLKEFSEYYIKFVLELEIERPNRCGTSFYDNFDLQYLKDENFIESDYTNDLLEKMGYLNKSYYYLRTELDHIIVSLKSIKSNNFYVLKDYRKDNIKAYLYNYNINHENRVITIYYRIQ